MFPLSVAAILMGDGEDDGSFDIYLNRSGINSIEAPRAPVRVRIGGMLRLRFLNRGSPVHITISSPNIGTFSPFFHENLYVVDETLLTIPIREDSHEGFFDIEITSGYGVMKNSFRVEVYKRKIPEPAKRPAEPPLQPVAHGRPHPLMTAMGIALILYCAWLYLKIDILNTASFLALIIGAVYTWYRQDSHQ
ncbi:MAG: hypothetical protein A4E35_01392 [Methanoregula sp. PtaU1.Bin051]|nr:MAG: hypothetical protein A4E35_01392 [Methanoregula sp. PtaU1.Bin051]